MGEEILEELLSLAEKRASLCKEANYLYEQKEFEFCISSCSKALEMEKDIFLNARKIGLEGLPIVIQQMEISLMLVGLLSKAEKDLVGVSE